MTTPSPDSLRLRVALEASGEVIFMTDPRGVFSYVNPEFVRVYGYRPDEVIGHQTPRILKGGQTTPEEYRSFWARLTRHEVVKREFVNRTRAGNLVQVESSVNPIVEDGVCAGYLAVQRDITDRKSLEQQFAHAQKMEAIGRLAGGIAHDFNNLLTAILGYSELLLEHLADDPSVSADIGEIKKAGERGSRLTRQLLAFSRQQVLQPQILDLNVVVLDLEKMLRRVIGEDLQLDVVAAVGLEPVKADPGQIEQLILNLAVNARDAMPSGGTLSVTTANCNVDAAFAQRHDGAAPGRYVALAVADTGTGMSPDVLAHVCEPFFTTKPVGQGTGLGLATVFGVVKQSGGFLVIDSALGKGTTVTAYLPVATGAVEAPRPAAPTVERPAGETILLVEDEPGIREVMKRSLERSGYTVLAAESTADALAIAESRDAAIDLLLSDVIMPGTSGPALAQRIVHIRPSIRVLYVSGFPNRVGLGRGLTSARAMFLPKPFTPNALVSKVKECLAIPF